MTPVIPDEGCVAFMDVLVFSIQGGRLNSKIHLFTNDYIPSRNTTLASFVESTAGGMTAIALSTPVNNGVDFTGRDIWTFPPTVFIATGPGLPIVVYGYWVDFTDPITATTKVLWTQRLQTPQAIIAAGNSVKFTLSFGGKQC